MKNEIDSKRIISGCRRPNRDVLLKGWVRTRRGNKQVAFIAVNDGTMIHNIQVVADLQCFSGGTIEKGYHRFVHQCHRETGGIHGQGSNTWKFRHERYAGIGRC